MQVGNITATFTRPANTTAYAANQLVANSVTAGAVLPMVFQLDNSFPMGQFRLTRARIYKNGVVVTNANFRLHLFQAAPVSAAGDGQAFSCSGAADWLGNVDISSMIAFTDGANGTGSCAAGSEMIIRQKSGAKIYGLLQALGAYVPGNAEVFTVVLEVVEAY